MWTTFKYTAKMLTRTPSLFVWAFAFPILLSTLFMFMFSGLDAQESISPVPSVVVADAAYEGSAFAQMIDQLSTGDDPLLDVRQVASEDAARDLVRSGEVAGGFSVDDEGNPVLIAAAGTQSPYSSLSRINATILQTTADSYAQNAELLTQIARTNPLALADADAVQQALDAPAATEQVSLTHGSPSQSVRFYYALLGMAALFTSQVAMFALCQVQPNLSILGARRTVGALSRTKTLAATLTASWSLALACLLAAFAYIRFVVGVDFGGREGLCMVGLAAAALLATALGTLIGALPKMSLPAKSGILTGATCFLSLFAGLYGEPCMQLADDIARAFPITATLNPAKLTTDLFYSLYYYDALGPFFEKMLVLLAFGAVLFALSALFIRRHRYEHL